MAMLFVRVKGKAIGPKPLNEEIVRHMLDRKQVDSTCQVSDDGVRWVGVLDHPAFMITAPPPPLPPPPLASRLRVWHVLAALAVVGLVVVGALIAHGRQTPSGSPPPPVADTPRRQPPETGLALESLRLAAHTVHGEFSEVDMLENDVCQWTGSASVIRRDGDKLVLVSNSHVLGLKKLADSDDSKDRRPEIGGFAIRVTFASGRQLPVTRFADQDGKLDLALLEVDAGTLVEGTDYVVVAYDRVVEVHIGDEVVAVGSPLGLDGTHTFGRVSAIRNGDDGEPFRAFQTDAAINPGNSGGPLFVKSGTGYKWIGVNTFTVGGDNLGFAIDARHVSESSYHWFSADPSGASAAIRQTYGRDAVVE